MLKRLINDEGVRLFLSINTYKKRLELATAR